MLRWLALFFGPIFAKELVEISRRKRYYFNRFLYSLALLLVMYMVWSRYSWQLRQFGPQAQRALVRMAESLFHAVSGVQFASVFLFVPLFVCGVVASEREERTLDLLFTTDLSDREIVLGKLASRVAALVLIILCGLPVLSLVMLFGGIDPEGLWRVMASTLVAVVFVGAHAMYFSTTTKSPIGALVRTYWWLAVWLLGVPIVIGMVTAAIRPGRGAEMLILGLLMFINPIATFILALSTVDYDRIVGFFGFWFYPVCLLAPLAWSVFLIMVAVRRVRQEPTPFWSWLQHLPKPRLFYRRKREPEPNRIRAEWTWWGKHVGNPLWLRSRLARVYDREGHIGRIQLGGWLAAAFFFILVAVCEPRGIRDEECSMSFLSVTWIGLLLLAVIFAGTSVVGDRRRGFFDLVLMTPLTGKEIVDGTLLAVWHHLRRVFWLPWVLCLLFCFTGASLPIGVICSLITATLFTTLVVVYGVGFAMTARTIPAALVPTFLFPIIANGIAILIPIFEKAHGVVLWLMSASLLVAGLIWVRRRTTPASVACFFVGLYLVLASAASCWTIESHQDELPIAAMHPAVLTIVMLDSNPRHWYRHNFFVILPMYWTALLINIFVARWWLIRNFEHLVDRTETVTAVSSDGTFTSHVLAAQVRTGESP